MAIALTLAILAVLLVLCARWLRQRSGLPAGRLIYDDTGAWQRNERSLFSPTHGLVGKPDYLVRQGDAVVPVEVKSSLAPAQPWAGHVLQLAAYCLLVEEALGARVTHGILRYADKQFAIPYTPELKAALLRALGDMRAALAAGDAPRNHHDAARCARCGLREACDERLTL